MKINSRKLSSFLVKAWCFVAALTFVTCSLSPNGNVFANGNFDAIIEDDAPIYIKNTDGLMIPDKYNSGVDPSITLTKHYPSETSFEVNGLKFVGRENMNEIQLNLSHTPNIEDGAVFVIENIDFSNSKMLRFQDYNHFADSGKKVTIIFKNCKFSSFYAEVNSPLFNTEFYDCDFNHAGGTHMKFERCLFHSLNGDMMNPLADVAVKDSYMYYDGENYTDKTVHIDGFQSYGFQNHPEIDVENIHFDNVRIEMPAVRVQDENNEWFAPLVNAPIMVQGEFSTNMHDITLENMHINGGANSIYLWCKTGKECETISNTTLDNIQVGYGHVYGIFYGKSDGVDTATTTITNVDHVTSLYAGSTWKASDGIHISVTNELLSERTLKCVADNSTISTHTIAAHPVIPVDNSNHPADIMDYPVAADMPFDLDIKVADATANEVTCYDITDEEDLDIAPLVRTAKFDPSVVLTSNNQGGQTNQGGQSNQNGDSNQNGNSSQTNQTNSGTSDNEPQSISDAPSTKEELPTELPSTGGIGGAILAALGAGTYVALLSYLVVHFSNKRNK